MISSPVSVDGADGSSCGEDVSESTSLLVVEGRKGVVSISCVDDVSAPALLSHRFHAMDPEQKPSPTQRL